MEEGHIGEVHESRADAEGASLLHPRESGTLFDAVTKAVGLQSADVSRHGETTVDEIHVASGGCTLDIDKEPVQENEFTMKPDAGGASQMQFMTSTLPFAENFNSDGVHSGRRTGNKGGVLSVEKKMCLTRGWTPEVLPKSIWGIHDTS